MPENEIRTFTEHHNFPDGEEIRGDFKYKSAIPFRNHQDKYCVSIFNKSEEVQFLHTSYFIGVDWLDFNNEVAVYVEPKLNTRSSQTNYLEMLFACLRYSEITKYTRDLYEIKFDAPSVRIPQSYDLLTPLLVVQFLQVVKTIVRKGLKKSFYKVEKNLNSRIKGKILIAKNIKHNVFKNKLTSTYCSFEEFGINNLENRLLKKALMFVQRYLPNYLRNSGREDILKRFTSEIFNYIMPAFQMVEDEIDLNEIKHSKTNVFYKEYAEGLHLARLILKRFGYNITNTVQGDSVKVQPFWIDMSKLFELFVLTKLKDTFHFSICYQFPAAYGNPDYLLDFNGHQMVIDAKYKYYYKYSLANQSQYYKINIVKDIRQVSGYARDREVRNHFNLVDDRLIDCLIIYPDAEANDSFTKDILITSKPIPEFANFFQIGIKLPTINM